MNSGDVDYFELTWAEAAAWNRRLAVYFGRRARWHRLRARYHVRRAARAGDVARRAFLFCCCWVAAGDLLNLAGVVWGVPR